MQSDSFEVYRDERFVLGAENGNPYLLAKGRRFTLSCHPYEPCLYIRDESGSLTVVHNAFDPVWVLDAFRNSRTVTSITGLVYTARDFCRMVENAVNCFDIRIDEAEQIFGEGKKKAGETASAGKISDSTSSPAPPIPDRCPDDPFYALIAEYPDCIVDYCIVKDDLPYSGCESHRRALASVCGKLFTDGGVVIWRCDVGKAAGEKTDPSALFAPAEKSGLLNYRKAFLCPPHGNDYTDADFERVNAALFPNGTEGLVVYRWTTDWSEYFDDGHEWWGTLCLTAYDKYLDRIVVILASATD